MNENYLLLMFIRSQYLGNQKQVVLGVRRKSWLSCFTIVLFLYKKNMIMKEYILVLYENLAQIYVGRVRCGLIDL